MFKTDANYIFFLKKMEIYLSPVLEIYAWCLMNNHFHLMVRIKTMNELTSAYRSHGSASHNKKTWLNTDAVQNPIDVHAFVSNQFKKLFQSYAMAFNSQESRIGSLFQNPFKRALVDDDAYFQNLIYYIHANPPNAWFC